MGSLLLSFLSATADTNERVRIVSKTDTSTEAIGAVMSLYASFPRGYNRLVGYIHQVTGAFVTCQQYEQFNDEERKACGRNTKRYEVATLELFPVGTAVVVLMEQQTATKIRVLVKNTGKQHDKGLGTVYTWESVVIDPISGKPVADKKAKTLDAIDTERY